jgi:hypothetical protein
LTQSHDEAVARAARLLAGALSELQRAATEDSGVNRDALIRSQTAVEELTRRIEQQLLEDGAQRRLIAEQLSNLAGSLDRLVTHMESLSQLMGSLLDRAAKAPEKASEPAVATHPPEPVFRPGGEGIALTVVAVPGFQALMDVQKALVSMSQVSAASVERFQEGDSRIQLQLRSPATASELAGGLNSLTGYTFTVEEGRPEVARLRLKIVGQGTTAP